MPVSGETVLNNAVPREPAAEIHARAHGEQSDAYDRARAACDSAMTAAGEQLFERHFVFGGHQVRMRVADVWDERAVGVPYPLGGDLRADETIWPIGQGCLAVSPATRFVRYDCSSWVTWLDRAAGRVVGWRANADRLSVHERTRPIPFLLPVWYGDRGLDIVHAGLIARGDKGGVVLRT